MALLDHPWTFFALVLTAQAVATEIGSWVALRTSVNADEDRHEHLAAMRDTLGVLLSLLLGFTLAMELPRFDHRRELLIDEASAIGTTSLRAQMLPEPVRSKMSELLREYVVVRLTYSTALPRSEQLRASIERTNQLQNALWEQSVVAAHDIPTPVTALFVQSLNEAIDLSGKEQAAIETRIPGSVWVMLILIAIVFCVIFGYSERRSVWQVTLILPLIIATVMALTADLDSPRSGLVRTDVRSLRRLQQAGGQGAPTSR